MSKEFTVSVPVRYRDLDTENHVNNVVVGTYLEEARTAYVHEVMGLDLETYNFVLANLEIDFGRPIVLEDDLTVSASVSELGETSATMVYDVRSEGETVATGETTLVFVDPEEKRPSPIPAEIRERIVEFEGLE